jgi:membrane protein
VNVPNPEPAPKRRLSVEDLWAVDLSALSRVRRLGVRAARLGVLVFKGFIADECPLRASALTFSTLMALIPLLMLSLSLARLFGGEQIAHDRIADALRTWAESFPTAGPQAAAAPAANVANEILQVVDYVFDQIRKVNFAAIGAVGLILLLWMTTDVLAQVERSFNRVWGVTKDRPFWRRTADYFTLLVILPVLILGAVSLPIADIVTDWVGYDVQSGVHRLVDPGVLRSLTVLFMTTASLTFLIKFLPNARVRLLPALIGGLVAALMFIGWLRMCTALQAMAVGYGRIYGSFAIVPLLLAWVYMSWSIILLGAETAFAVQNGHTFPMELASRQASAESRLTLAAALLAECARPEGGQALDVEHFAVARRIPVRLANEVVDTLVQAGLLGRLAGSPTRYALLRPPETVTVGSLCAAILGSGIAPAALGLTNLDPSVRRVCRDALTADAANGRSLTLRDLANPPAPTA